MTTTAGKPGSGLASSFAGDHHGRHATTPGPAARGVVLRLLDGNGYRAILDAGADPTLGNGPAGIEVVGRGTRHQIDAIADYRFSPPFSQPYRLLVEGKSLKGAVGLPIVRNAVGVVRDVSEAWDDRSQPRFHYQYAIFCDTRFTAPAQDYAFVQDIFLLPLAQAATLGPVLAALGQVDLPAPLSRTQLKDVRRQFREALRTGEIAAELALLCPVVEAARAIGVALVGMTMNGMPLVLIPQSRLRCRRPAVGGAGQGRQPWRVVVPGGPQRRARVLVRSARTRVRPGPRARGRPRPQGGRADPRGAVGDSGEPVRRRDRAPRAVPAGCGMGVERVPPACDAG